MSPILQALPIYIPMESVSIVCQADSIPYEVSMNPFNGMAVFKMTFFLFVIVCHRCAKNSTVSKDLARYRYTSSHIQP